MSNICKNCKFFERWKGEKKAGVCAMATNQLTVRDPELESNVINIKMGSAILIGEEFGCIHFEQKETE